MRSGMRKFRKSHLVFAVYVFLAVCCFLLNIPGQIQASEAASFGHDQYQTEASEGASFGHDQYQTEASEGASPDYNQYQRRVFNIDSTLHCEKTTAVADTEDGECTITVGAEIANVEQASSLAFGQSHMAAAAGEDGFLTLIRNDEAWDVVLPDEDYGYTAVSFSEENQLYAGRDDGYIDRFDLSGDTLLKNKTIDTGSGSAVNSIMNAMTEKATPTA